MSILTNIRRHAVISTIIAMVVVIIAVIAGRAVSKTVPVTNSTNIKQVTLVNVATFRQGNISVSADGIVEAHSQADLRSQTSAPVAIINVSLGDNVYSGQVILELQNADTKAQLSQAEASLLLARSQFSTGAISLDSARQNAIDKIRDAYIKTNDAVVSQAVPILYNNDGNGGRLTSFTTDTKLYSEITAMDIDLRSGLRDWKTAVDSLSVSTSTDLINATFRLAKTNITKADILLNDMSKITNDLSSYATPSFAVSVNSWKSVISTAHASVTGASQSLTAAEATLNTSVSSQGGTVGAQIAVAAAGVSNLEAQLAKTIVRSPISGKVSTLPLREGELATPGTLLATIIGNDSGIEIKAYASGEDLSRIKVGDPVIIQRQVLQNGSSTFGTVSGIVSNVAPGVDSITKKAEVDINVDNPTVSGLVIGQNVTVAISTRKNASQSSLPTNSQSNLQSAIYLLPIQDVKIIPGTAYVFTVDSNFRIVRNDVTLGAVRGDFIEVVGGLNDAMNIVTPVYEMEEGLAVKVQ